MMKFPITGLGPVSASGDVEIFTCRPLPFQASKDWLVQYPALPQVGDELVFDDAGNMTLEVHAANAVKDEVETKHYADGISATGIGPLPDQSPAEREAAQKKTDGAEGSDNGSKRSLGHFRGKPVLVTAGSIVEVGEPAADGSCTVTLEDGSVKTAYPAMLSRITPQLGDYWVIQSQADGEYEYLNPKDVFERKYEPVEE